MQTTLRTAVTFTGVGLHTGEPVRMTVHPASAGTGIRFRRTDVAVGRSDQDAIVAARWDAVVPSKLCTLIENADGV